MALIRLVGASGEEDRAGPALPQKNAAGRWRPSTGQEQSLHQKLSPGPPGRDSLPPTPGENKFV